MSDTGINDLVKLVVEACWATVPKDKTLEVFKETLQYSGRAGDEVADLALLAAMGFFGYNTPALGALADLLCIVAGGSAVGADDLVYKKEAWNVGQTCAWIGVQGVKEPTE